MRRYFEMNKLSIRMAAIMVLAIFVILSTCSCSKLILVEEPQMRMLGGKTLIEAQVLGRYRQIDEAAYQLSVLTGDNDTLSLIAVDTNQSQAENDKYKTALIRSMYNEDEIISYKKEYYIGENNKGYLSFMVDEIEDGLFATASTSKSDYIKSVMDKENEDRKTVAQYLILSDEKLSMANISQVENALYKRNMQTLVVGTYYQLPDNTWLIYTNIN